MARKANADYRPLMIEAAVRCILDGEAVTIAAIADEFGVSKSLVHFYFGSHDALVDAAWSALFMMFLDNDLADAARLGDAVGWDGWTDLVAYLFARDRDAGHRAYVRASAEAQSGGSPRQQLDASTAATIGGWQTLIKQYSEIGAVTTPLDPTALAVLVAAVPLGVAVVSPDLTDDLRAKVAEAWATMLRAVLDDEFNPHTDPPT